MSEAGRIAPGRGPVVNEPPLDWPHYNVNFASGVKRGFRKYATFNGRASAAEFWWFSLFTIGVLLALLLLEAAAGVNTGFGTFLSFLVVLAWLALLLPNVAVTVRRLHDTGRSGLNYLWTFVPFVGGIILLVLICGGTTLRAQRYGPPYAPVGS